MYTPKSPKTLINAITYMSNRVLALIFPLRACLLLLESLVPFSSRLLTNDRNEISFPASDLYWKDHCYITSFSAKGLSSATLVSHLLFEGIILSHDRNSSYHVPDYLHSTRHKSICHLFLRRRYQFIQPL